ncbi:MAG TPA: DUF5916 domain-containing protein, partial [Longimicrobiales bacterium]|nr:DUF5916 domain-containing protein [Longimicrobiales bacterium]
AALLAAQAALPLAAQEEGGDLRAHRLPEGTDVRLDGSLSEAFWEDALPITDFTQQEPVEGGVPSQRTEIRFVYDADALYIGAMLFDDPEGILAYQKRRDQGLGTDDRFMWILDTFRDGRTGYFFEINANGLMGDGLMGGGGGGGFGGFGGFSGFGGGGVNKSWDGIWEARVSRLPDGWSAEIRIPFSTLNFDPAADAWGINFQRTIRRHNEEILWRGWRRNQGISNPVFAGQVTGLTGLSQGIGLEVKPYATQSWREVSDESSYPGDVGVDVSYSITSGLRAAVSYNTDFAEVEVDQRRVNLTRFPQRFPEQRDFFLEGSGVYSFAPRSGPTPYFSRRIGLEGGEAIPIDYGARLGGQAGPFELGFIQVGTGATGSVPSESFSVARVKRRLFTQSSIGAIYTRRAPGADSLGVTADAQHTAGLDLDFKTASLPGGNNLEMEAFLVWNSSPDPGASPTFQDLSAWGLRANVPNDVYQGHVSYREFGNAYDPAVGFVTRNNFRRVEPRVAWSPRPESIAWLRQVEFSLQYRQLNNLDSGLLEERTWDFGLLGLNFESGDNLELRMSRQYEFLGEAFEVNDGVEILPGGYTTWETTLQARTAGRRPVSLRGEVSQGDFWDGDRWRYSVDLTLRPRPGYSVSVDYEHNQVNLPAGEFDTNLVRLNGGWDISPWASLTTNVQYDDVSEVLGLFGLLRWIVTPGNEVFLVFTQNWERLGPEEDILDRRFSTLSRGASVKVNYTWRW